MYEILFLCFFIWVLTLNISWIVVVNLQWLKVSTSSVKYWNHTIQWLLFDPLLIISLFDLTLKAKSKVEKVTILLTAIILLTFFQYCFIFLGVVRIQHWNVAFSLIQWILIVFICYGFWKRYRKLLFKEELI
ncbi:heme/copper-type cytochrome/quinol oxidase subunit 4 [Neobacillus cucumis]|uniref:hypothetical protein n=1 Tax=Neobacillus cucumis TaxID=1740721 RepID=UPI00196613A8|nr:hypothetical protein [Neobacillus cucumis]MBM7656537.1 heme/copper-type cytochrome/quinol oxidase subunit 4 [Neobacillus cucumis]